MNDGDVFSLGREWHEEKKNVCAKTILEKESQLSLSSQVFFRPGVKWSDNLSDRWNFAIHTKQAAFDLKKRILLNTYQLFQKQLC